MAVVTLSWTIILFNVALCLGNLYEGDVCVLKDSNGSGVCVNIANCSHALDAIKQLGRPEICGFVGKHPIVCCPNNPVDFRESAGGKSQKKCLEYYDPTRFVISVAGGTEAASKEFPHMAAVGFRAEDNTTLWLCGGTLISEYFILTAAHCTFSQEFGAPKVVRLGDLDLKNETDDANPINLEIAEIINHPEYKPSTHYNDIALLRLKAKVIFGVYYKPACLHTLVEVPKILTATGWGKTEFLGTASSHLLKVNVSLIQHETCAKKYGIVRKLPNGISKDSQICAGDKDGKDTCPGDSGGPLQILNQESEKLRRHFVVVGITSFGKGCGIAETAGVYTKVSAYTNWIENNVWPS